MLDMSEDQSIFGRKFEDRKVDARGGGVCGWGLVEKLWEGEKIGRWFKNVDLGLRKEMALSLSCIKKFRSNIWIYLELKKEFLFLKKQAVINRNYRTFFEF